MSNVWFAGDLHLGHRNIAKFRTIFQDEMEHREWVVKMINATVGKRDKIFFTGDTVLHKDALECIEQIKCGSKVLILGNHCTERVHITDLTKVFDHIHGMLKYRDFWITHAPLHPEELRGKRNVHGHVHDSTVADPRYINTSIESKFMGYGLQDLNAIRAQFKAQQEYTCREDYFPEGTTFDERGFPVFDHMQLFAKNKIAMTALHDVKMGTDMLGLNVKRGRQ